MLEVSLAGAFLGGTLALLSPCSALLLPAFLAYACQTRRHLVLYTGVFLLGLSSLFIPAGLGAGLISGLLLKHRDTLILVAGGLLLAFGVAQLLGIGFAFAPARLKGWAPRGRGWPAVYGLGLVYGFAGVCSGPILGAVLTMAATADRPLNAAALLFAYALGMTLPAFVLAALWDRYDLGRRPWLRGSTLRWGPLRVHSTQAIAGLLFVALGMLFILTRGTLALERTYEVLGLVSLSFRLQGTITRFAAWPAGWWLVLVLVLVLGAAVLWRRVRRRKGVV